MVNLQDALSEKITKPLEDTENPLRLIIGVIAVAVLLGAVTGYILSTKINDSQVSSLIEGEAKSAQQDIRTFKDFAEGVIQVKPAPADPSEYVEGTHMLIREGAVPVALTSSVTDLSQYEGKKVKIFGETQKAIKEGWLMDVGRVEEIK